MIRAADLVLAGNETIAEHASGMNGDVRIQPTPVDTEQFRPRTRPERSRPLVGWVGSPTAAYCLKEIAPALTRAAKEVPFDLLVVGAGEEIEVPGVRVLGKDWSLEDEPFDFSSLDVGLYPLPDNEWTRGKCGMKALQYMASGVPAVVSPVGVNVKIVRDGTTGLLARTPEEWTESLLTYLRDPDLRDRHATAGRAAAEERWSLAALTGSFVEAMKDLVS
jgi:glycosyltransferase involved in cell wall biosynthesis